METNQNQPPFPLTSPPSQQINQPPKALLSTSKKNKWLKIIFILLACLFLIAIGVFGFWYYQEKVVKKPTPSVIPSLLPTPIPISSPVSSPNIPVDWKTYKNEEYGFEFKYPDKKFNISLDNETQYGSEVNGNPKNDFIKYMGYPPPKLLYAIKIIDKMSPAEVGARIWIFDNAEEKDIERWYKDYWYYPFFWGKGIEAVIEENKPKREIKINQVNGKYAYVDSKGKIKYIYFNNNGKMFLFDLKIVFDELRQEELPNINDQILSTFKFIN